MEFSYDVGGWENSKFGDRACHIEGRGVTLELMRRWTKRLQGCPIGI